MKTKTLKTIKLRPPSWEWVADTAIKLSCDSKSHEAIKGLVLELKRNVMFNQQLIVLVDELLHFLEEYPDLSIPTQPLTDYLNSWDKENNA